MKTIFYVLTICLLIISCGTTQEEQTANVEPTLSPGKNADIKIKKKLYAELIVEDHHAESATWRDDKTLVVVYHPNFLSQIDKNDKNEYDKFYGKMLADSFAIEGSEYIGKYMCVKIYYPDGSFLSSTCAGDE